MDGAQVAKAISHAEDSLEEHMATTPSLTLCFLSKGKACVVDLLRFGLDVLRSNSTTRTCRFFLLNPPGNVRGVAPVIIETECATTTVLRLFKLKELDLTPA